MNLDRLPGMRKYFMKWKYFTALLSEKNLDYHCCSSLLIFNDVNVQVIKKVLQGSVLVQQVMYHVDQSLAFAMRRKGADALTAWERAMAVYYGADVDCAVFGNGQSRGIEFGTLKEGMAETNYLVGEEFGEGKQQLVFLAFRNWTNEGNRQYGRYASGLPFLQTRTRDLFSVRK